MNTESDALAEAIAVSLNVEREAAGWKLADLAAELGLSEQTLGRYLTRRTRSLPVDVLTAACVVMGVPIADVITRAQQRLENTSVRSQDRAKGIAAQARAQARKDHPKGEPESGKSRSKRGA